MSPQPLKVNTDVLRNVSMAFKNAGDGLAELGADAPLADAASAVPQLETATACRNAQDDIAKDMTTGIAVAREYSGNLITAANRYESRDRASAEVIRKVAPTE